MIMLMQKEIEVLQDHQLKPVKHPLNFAEFVKNVEINVEKSLLSRRNRQLMRQKLKQNWLFKSKIIPPSFSKIGQENQPPSPKIIICPPSIFNSSQTCPVTQHEISANLCEPSPQRSEEKKFTRAQCKTSYDGARSLGSYKRIKSSWKLQFRRDELNVLKYQRKSEEQIREGGDQAHTQKSFKVRKVHKKFEEIKHQSCQIYRTNLQIEEKSTNINKGPYRTLDSSSIYRRRSPQ